MLEKIIVKVITAFILLASSVSASGSQPAGKSEKKTASDSEIRGKIQMNSDVKAPVNLLNRNSKAIFQANEITGSRINGDAKTQLKANTLSNKVYGEKNVGSLQAVYVNKSTLGMLDLEAKVRNATNEIKGGSNNKAFTSLATLENSTVSGKAKVSLTVTQDMKNTVHGGHGNTAIMNAGTIKEAKLWGADIGIHAKGLTNEIHGGTANVSELNMGAIE